MHFSPLQLKGIQKHFLNTSCI